MELEMLLEESRRDHDHLCPRQVLGVRTGLAGLQSLGFSTPPTEKRLLVISETDGCFVSGLMAATGCAVHHRTLRVVDYGKTAAVFVDTFNDKAVRVAPAAGIRTGSLEYAPGQPDTYQAMLEAYKVMPTQEMFKICPVALDTPVNSLISRPGMRAICAHCGEEIMNEREVLRDGTVLCKTCSGVVYYHPAAPDNLLMLSPLCEEK